MEMDNALTTVRGVTITVRDVFDHLKVTGVFRNAIYRLIEREVLRLHMEERGLLGDREEREAFLDNQRQMLGLAGAREMNDFCRWHGISLEMWKEQNEVEWMRRKLRLDVVTEAEVERYFEVHRDDLKMLCLSRIVAKERAVADRVMAEAESRDVDFAALARDSSPEEADRIVWEHLGCFKKGMLPPEINGPVFRLDQGGVAGPFSQNGLWSIYKVEEVQNVALDQHLHSQIVDTLFAIWLDAEVRKARA